MPSVHADHREAFRRRAGMRETELMALVMVLSGYAVTSKPVPTREIRANLLAWENNTSGANVLAALERRGWVREAGRNGNEKLWVPTARGWQFLGLLPRKAA